MSRKIKWKSEFRIGIAAIDRQHQEIFERLLAIESSIEKRDPWHIQRFHILELFGSLKFHFAVEESLLDIVGYPQHDQHAGRHASLLAAAAELEARVQKQGSVRDLVDFFEDWFLRHVLSEDAEYVAFVRQRLALPAA